MLVSSFHRTRMPRLLAWAGARSGECFGWSAGRTQVGLAAGRGGSPALARRHGARGKLAGGRWARAPVRIQQARLKCHLADLGRTNVTRSRLGRCSWWRWLAGPYRRNAQGSWDEGVKGRPSVHQGHRSGVRRPGPNHFESNEGRRKREKLRLEVPGHGLKSRQPAQLSLPPDLAMSKPHR